MIAAPTLSLIDEAFVPGAIILVNLPLTFGMAARERDHIDWSIMRAVPARAVGSLIGAVLVVQGGQRAIAIVIAFVIITSTLVVAATSRW